MTLIGCTLMPVFIFSGETWISMEEYTAEGEDELSFGRGAVMDILHKLLDGWWIAW